MKLLSLLLFISSPCWASLLYTPVHFKSETARLVVVLHGCLQSAESMALGTGWNQIADQNNLVILYPQAPPGSNPIGCWNWYLPENQRADRGQLKLIHDDIFETLERLQMKNAKIYLAGLSSGATTVAGLISCYPQDFTAAAIHSGPSYGLAQNLFEGNQVLKDGPPSTRPPTSCNPNDFTGSLILIQGSDDHEVNPKNADQVIADFARDAKALPPQDFTSGGLSYQVTDYWQKTNLKLRYVNIHGFPHAWAGFVKNLRYPTFVGPDSKNPTQIPFFNATGPSSTNLIWDFFKQ